MEVLLFWIKNVKNLQESKLMVMTQPNRYNFKSQNNLIENFVTSSTTAVICANHDNLWRNQGQWITKHLAIDVYLLSCKYQSELVTCDASLYVKKRQEENATYLDF